MFQVAAQQSLMSPAQAVCRWVLVVVVLDVLVEQSSELVFVSDDGPVQQFMAEGSDPSFCECARLR